MNMKKVSQFFLLTFVIFFASILTVSAQDTMLNQCIIDELNEEAIDDIVDRGSDHTITDEELAKITSLSCNGSTSGTVKDTSIIEKLTSLTSLSLSDNALTSIDVSHLTALTSLNLAGNQLTTIDLSKNTVLAQLTLTDNNLSSLDVKGNTALTYLAVGGNHLPLLDLSQNTNLATFAAGKQTVVIKYYKVSETVEEYFFNVRSLDSIIDFSKIQLQDEIYEMNNVGGVYFTEIPEKVTYSYETGGPSSLEVTMTLDYAGVNNDKGSVAGPGDGGSTNEPVEDNPDHDLTDNLEDTTVSVPDTAMNRSVFLISIALFLIVGGVGVFYIQLGRKK